MYFVLPSYAKLLWAYHLNSQALYHLWKLSCQLISDIWSLWSGPSCSEATLEPVSYPVWQQHRKPLGCPALSFLHSFLHHWGTGLLQHRRSLGTHERQRLPRLRCLHTQVRQPLRLTQTVLSDSAHPTITLKICHMLGARHPGKLATSHRYIEENEWGGKRIVHPGCHASEGNYDFLSTPTQVLKLYCTVSLIQLLLRCALSTICIWTALLGLRCFQIFQPD